MDNTEEKQKEHSTSIAIAMIAAPLQTVCPVPFDNMYATAYFRCAFVGNIPMKIIPLMMLSRYFEGN